MNSFWMIFGAWVAAGGTLCVFSFLYDDNPLFKAAEHLFVGVSLGYYLTILFFNTFLPKLWDPLMAGNVILLLPAVMGILMLTRLLPKYSYMSRFSFAFIMGYTSGLTIPAAIVSRFLKQLEGAIQPLFTRTDAGVLDFSGVAIGHSLSVLVGVVGLLSVLIFFFFSVEHKGPITKISKVGRYFIMIYLGAAFGTTVMGRFALLYGRVFDLYTFRTSMYYYATPILLIVIIFFLTVHTLKQKKPKQES
ncbi:hypothetical protein ACFL2T_05655 [Elusimicrobiota bacterium]